MNALAEVPSGEIACVFTDITDSTNLWSYNQAEMWEALQIHNKIVRKELDRFSGYEVKTLGDGFHIIFTNPASALRLCLSAQLCLHTADWPRAVVEYYSDKEFFEEETEATIFCQGLSVRMGLHFGQPFVSEKNSVSQRMDIFGTMVNCASRIQSQAGGGEIAISDAFIMALLRSQSCAPVDPNITLNDDLRERILSTEVSSQFFTVRFVGEVALKGILDPIYITMICFRRRQTSP